MASAAADARWCPVRLRVGGVRGRRGHMRGGAPSVSRTGETVATAANARWCPPARLRGRGRLAAAFRGQRAVRPLSVSGAGLSRPARGASPVRLRGGGGCGRLSRPARGASVPRPAPWRGRPRPPFAACAQCVPPVRLRCGGGRGRLSRPTRSASPICLHGGGSRDRRRSQHAVRPPSVSRAGEVAAAAAANAQCVPRPAPGRGRLAAAFHGRRVVRPPSGSVAGEAAAAFRGRRVGGGEKVEGRPRWGAAWPSDDPPAAPREPAVWNKKRHPGGLHSNLR